MRWRTVASTVGRDHLSINSHSKGTKLLHIVRRKLRFQRLFPVHIEAYFKCRVNWEGLAAIIASKDATPGTAGCSSNWRAEHIIL